MEEEERLRDDISGGDDNHQKEELYSRVVRAGKRTYFFDVKSTRYDELFLTITESKKKTGKDGKAFYEKHKIFLYKEDFDKFEGGLNDVLDFISKGHDSSASVRLPEAAKAEKTAEEPGAEFTNIDFDDLGKTEKEF